MKLAFEDLLTMAGIGVLGYSVVSLLNPRIELFPTETTPTGTTDSNGIQWLYADGEITTIAQSSTQSNDHRWFDA